MRDRCCSRSEACPNDSRASWRSRTSGSTSARAKFWGSLARTARASMNFKTIAGDSDQCSGILFNVKPNGDWLAVRYNEKDNDISLWEFHNGIRRRVQASDRSKPVTLDRSKWHELKMSVSGADFKAWIDGSLALEYTLGTIPSGGRGAPNSDLLPPNNPVLR